MKKRAVLFLTIFVVLLCSASGSLMAVISGDLYFIRRWGVIMLLFAAILVYYEYHLETMNHRLDDRDKASLNSDALSQGQMRTLQGLISKRMTARRERRHYVALSVLMLIFVGETLHGWGDLIFQFVFSYDPH